MILVELNGGLGNQLFQYAAAKSLAIHHGVDLKLDDSFFRKEGKSHSLYDFNINAPLAAKDEIYNFSKRSLYEKMADRLKPAYARRTYREPYFHFDKKFYAAPKDAYLKGTRQSEKYFLLHEHEIRKDLTIRPEFTEHVRGLSEKMKNENSVSVHIRRGDYLTEIALKVLGLLPLSYYQDAIKYIISRVDQPKFYFFSDDIYWVKQHIDIDFQHEFISGVYTNSSIEDFYLMQHCKHNIIANSSFSWWAAWLNKNPEKIVIAPKKWFNETNNDPKDLVPKEWIKL